MSARLYTAHCRECGLLDGPKPVGEAADTAERHRTLTGHDTRIVITPPQHRTGRTTTMNQTTPAIAHDPTLEEETLKAQLLDRQAARIIELQDEIHTRQQELDHLKTMILDTLPEGAHHTATGRKVTIRKAPARLDADRIQKDYPADAYPQLYRQALDTTSVRRAFAPDALSAYEKTGRPTVTVSAA